MKKRLCILLTLSMLFTYGCGTSTPPSLDTAPSTPVVEDATANNSEQVTDNAQTDSTEIDTEINTETEPAEKPIPEHSPYLVDIDTSSFTVTEEAFTDSSLEFAAKLKAGWNLGNTLDATGSMGMQSEVSWGQPKATKELIDFVKESGFTSIRLPISWGLHTDGDDYAIDPEWMARIHEVVDWSIDAGLYVVINTHHDNDFYYPTEEHLEKSLYFIDCIWSQVANEFRDYDEHLIFEAMNEPRLSDTDKEWYFNKGDAEGVEALACISALNQRFVDVVRSSGGNNTLRYLMLSGYAGNPDLTIDNNFEIATDPANHLLMSIHAYTPYDFAMNASGYRKWDKAYNSQFSFMDKAKEYFIDKGIGVAITEMGATNKNNLQSRALWFYYYTQKASELNISCFVWDNGNNAIGEECFAFLGRSSQTVLFPELLEGLTINYREEE